VESKPPWLTKRKIAVPLLIAFIVIDYYGWTTSTVQSITVPTQLSMDSGYWANIEPRVKAEIRIWMTASGALSVGNSVTVHAIVYDVVSNVTISDLTQYYNGIAFSDAYETTGNQNAKIPLIANSTNNGEYDADGTIVWLVEGPTWVYFLPNTSKNIVVNRADVTKGDFVVQITPVSDTLSIRNSVIEQRLTWILIGFSVLMLQPIFEALLLKEKKETVPKEEQAKSQGLWHQHKLWRKKQSQ
jgi:hypothetical protein